MHMTVATRPHAAGLMGVRRFPGFGSMRSIRGLWAVVLAAAVLALGLATAPACWAQYPARPIRIIVPISPGGAPDVAARVLGQGLAEALGMAVIIENKLGSNGNIAAEYVAKSPADGYTLLFGQDSLIVINPYIYERMPIEVHRDLVPVSTVASNIFVLSVNSSLPVKTFSEFIDYARKANPPLNYASGGNGSIHQLTMEMLKARAGINLVHVPYKGGSPATTATVAGDVAAMFAGTSTAPQIRAGRLRALAVTGARRSELFPDLPTIAEFYPGFEMTIWLGLFAPAGTPDAALARLRPAIAKVLGTEALKEKLNVAGGLQPLIMPTAEFQALIASDSAKYQKLIKAVGVRVD
jgi:tripartite-type tricarboxylate transporter receptor subunit TctC